MSVDTVIDADIPRTVDINATIPKKKQSSTPWEETESIMLIQSKYMA